MRTAQQIREADVQSTILGYEWKFNFKPDPKDATVVLAAVYDELMEATAKHGSMNSLHEAYSVILEELDEFWEEVKVNPKKLTQEQQQARLENMRTELIQVAAMAVRAIMDTL